MLSDVRDVVPGHIEIGCSVFEHVLAVSPLLSKANASDTLQKYSLVLKHITLGTQKSNELQLTRVCRDQSIISMSPRHGPYYVSYISCITSPY
jgi:hypothetical protein